MVRSWRIGCLSPEWLTDASVWACVLFLMRFLNSEHIFARFTLAKLLIAYYGRAYAIVYVWYVEPKTAPTEEKRVHKKMSSAFSWLIYFSCFFSLPFFYSLRLHTYFYARSSKCDVIMLCFCCCVFSLLLFIGPPSTLAVIPFGQPNEFCSIFGLSNWRDEAKNNEDKYVPYFWSIKLPVSDLSKRISVSRI